MKTILLTGGSGLLALNWARVLAETWSVRLLLNKRSVEPFGATSRRVDISSAQVFDSVLTEWMPDLVVHTAGLTNIEACEADPAAAHHVNVELARNVAQRCASHGIKLAHISTDHLFAGTQSNLDETAPPAPVNVYGQTKADAEAAAAQACPDALIIRTNFYSWGPSYRPSFSDHIIRSLREGRSIPTFEDVFFNPILVDALVDAVHRLADAGAAGIFNVVGDERLSKHEFALKVADRFGLDRRLLKASSIDDAAHLVPRPHDMSLSNKKTRDAVGKSLGDAAGHLAIMASQENSPRVQELQRL